MNKPFVALVDDEAEITAMVAEVLSTSYECRSFNSPQEFIEVMLKREYLPSVVITDYKMPGMNGVDMLHQLCSQEIVIPAILFSAYLDKEALAAAISVGVIDTLEKPLDLDTLVETVDRAMIDYELIKNHLEMVSTVRLLREVYMGFRQSLPKVLPPPLVTRLLTQPFLKKPGMHDWGFEKIMTTLEGRLNDLIVDEAILRRQKADKIKLDYKPKKT